MKTTAQGMDASPARGVWRGGRSTEYIGPGAVEGFLAALSRKEEGKRPLVVASGSSLDRHRARLAWLGEALGAEAVFSDFHANPSHADIVRGREWCRSFQPDMLIALGGGSAIDVAKGIKSAFPGNPFGEDPTMEEETLFVAIPTTAGSGSEATHFAVYYRDEEKFSLAHASLRPDVAVVDPALSSTMPAALTAATGFDALSQAIESLWARGATEESRDYALQALRLLAPNIERAVVSPEPSLRSAMAIGANLAGRAINVSKTTAPHAFSYFLTKRYGIPHGHAVALMMPFFMVINAGEVGGTYTVSAEQRLSAAMNEILRIFNCNTPAACAREWMRLMDGCGLAPTLGDLGIGGRDTIAAIGANANAERLSNNPVLFRREDLEMLMSEPDWPGYGEELR